MPESVFMMTGIAVQDGPDYAEGAWNQQYLQLWSGAA